MEDILRLFSTDISSVIVGIFVLLSAFIAIHEIITKTCEIFNVPIKWVKNKNADHNLLIQTTNELKSLEQQCEKDVRESKNNKNNIGYKFDQIKDSNNFSDLLMQYDFNSIVGDKINIDMKYIKEFIKVSSEFIDSRVDF